MTDGLHVVLEKVADALLNRLAVQQTRGRFNLLEKIEDKQLRRRLMTWYYIERQILFIFLLIVVSALTGFLVYSITTLPPTSQVYALMALILIIVTLWKVIVTRF
jgi:hypothetical protein